MSSTANTYSHLFSFTYLVKEFSITSGQQCEQRDNDVHLPSFRRELLVVCRQKVSWICWTGRWACGVQSCLPFLVPAGCGQRRDLDGRWEWRRQLGPWGTSRRLELEGRVPASEFYVKAWASISTGFTVGGANSAQFSRWQWFHELQGCADWAPRRRWGWMDVSVYFEGRIMPVYWSESLEWMWTVSRRGEHEAPGILAWITGRIGSMDYKTTSEPIITRGQLCDESLSNFPINHFHFFNANKVLSWEWGAGGIGP